jgi:hypothetical protein
LVTRGGDGAHGGRSGSRGLDLAQHGIPVFANQKALLVAAYTENEPLSPLVPELGETGVHQLASAVRAAVGIESLVWLTDVAGLSRDQAIEVMLWSAQAVLHHALSDGLPGPR